MAMYDLDSVIEKLRAELARIDGERQVIMDDLAAVHRAMALATGDGESGGMPVHGSVKPEHVAGCRTHLDAATIMAACNNGVLMVTAASKVIKAAGLSDAQAGSIAATLHNRVSSSEDWEYLAPGQFRYKGNTGERQDDVADKVAAAIRQTSGVIVQFSSNQKQELAERLHKWAGSHGGEVSFSNITEAIKRAAEKSNWNWTDQMIEKTASEMRRYLMKSEHWQYEPPDTFRLLISEADLTPVDIARAVAAHWNGSD